MPQYHHYVPSCLLSFFSDKPNGRKSKIWVSDLPRKLQWSSTSGESGGEGDFNRIEADGFNPLEIESEVFGRIESDAAPALSRLRRNANATLLIEALRFKPSKTDFESVMAFIAAQDIRVPDRRNNIDRLVTDLSRLLLERKLDKKARIGGMSLKDSRVAIRKTLKDPTFKVRYDSTGHLALLVPVMTKIYPTLLRRRWSIVIAPIDGPEFICSDNPVGIAELDDGPFAGHGVIGTLVFFPISSQHLMIGVQEEEPATNISIGVLPASTEMVFFANSGQVQSATKYVYSGKSVFQYWDYETSSVKSSESLVDCEV